MKKSYEQIIRNGRYTKVIKHSATMGTYELINYIKHHVKLMKKDNADFEKWGNGKTKIINDSFIILDNELSSHSDNWYVNMDELDFEKQITIHKYIDGGSINIILDPTKIHFYYKHNNTLSLGLEEWYFTNYNYGAKIHWRYIFNGGTDFFGKIVNKFELDAAFTGYEQTHFPANDLYPPTFSTCNAGETTTIFYSSPSAVYVQCSFHNEHGPLMQINGVDHYYVFGQEISKAEYESISDFHARRPAGMRTINRN